MGGGSARRPVHDRGSVPEAFTGRHKDVFFVGDAVERVSLVSDDHPDPFELRGITPARGLTLAPGGAILTRAQGANPDGVKNQIEGYIVQTTTPL
jgi:hypothetical protein